MGKVSFTPGPWDVDEGDLSIYALDGAGGAVLLFQTHDEADGFASCDEQEVNARLIAAAPELYDAAECALGLLTGNMDGDWSKGDPVHMLRAALSKARGEDPALMAEGGA
ncbi:hypothetical protein [Methylocaldum sp.]|uniref:hypothetical protein n=1 Tax=Methylocaldum sp. TaxID=1969727 RepID=UPI002D5681B8|nr:hypothetical protein [Methylocaldum sp.]HYE38195.1 hypothetical protein [Methylocaldum sp.]